MASGGHDIPTDTILRRYKRSVKNFLELYVPLADEWALYDNSQNTIPTMIAEKILLQDQIILDKKLWRLFKETYE